MNFRKLKFDKNLRGQHQIQLGFLTSKAREEQGQDRWEDLHN